MDLNTKHSLFERDKENLAYAKLQALMPPETKAFRIDKNKASAALGLALFMCFVAEDNPIRDMSTA